MKKLIISILCLLVSVALFSDPDFRKINWGMTKDQVKKIETAKFEQEDKGNLFYSTEVAGFKTALIYIFTGNKLTRAGYIFTQEHSNYNLFIDDFKKIDTLLIKKYGTPAQQELNWKNDLYKDSPQDWGTAVAIGQLAFYTDWQGENTYIEHDLYGDNFNLTHKILYVSQKLKDYEKKIKEKESINNL